MERLEKNGIKGFSYRIIPVSPYLSISVDGFYGAEAREEDVLSTHDAILVGEDGARMPVVGTEGMRDMMESAGFQYSFGVAGVCGIGV